MKILAISSGGGHWEQMMLLRPGFGSAEVIYANTLPGLAERSGISNATVITDCNRSEPLANVKCAWQLLTLIAKHRPNIVISTGAAPGIIALAIGRVFGAKTVWVDSVANSEKLSMSGKMAGKIAHLWVTQWEHLATPNGPHYLGSVL